MCLDTYDSEKDRASYDSERTDTSYILHVSYVNSNSVRTLKPAIRATDKWLRQIKLKTT
jgi:hypothetical protein